jgi:hypothetical protein
VAAPLYTSSAPLYEAGGASGDTPIAGSAVPVAPAIKPAGQSVNIIDPNTGETFGVDIAYLPQAEAQGFKVESAEHAGIRKYVAENKGISGAAKIALEGLIDEGTFGVGGVLLDKARDPYELAKHEALKADHQVANLTGRAAGFGLSLLYGGELFGLAGKAGSGASRAVLRGAEEAVGRAAGAELAYRGVEAGAQKVGSGIARKILASAADYGVQGAVLSSPKAMAQLITGDPERAAETWIYGAAGGAGLGALAGVGGSIAGKILARSEQSAPTQGGMLDKARSWASSTADKQAFRSIASNEASLGKTLKDLELQFGDDAADKAGRYMRENGLVKPFRESASDGAKRFAKNASEEGRAIGKYWDDVTTELGDTGRINPGEIATKVREKALRPLYEENFGMEGLAESLGKKLDSFERQMMKLAREDGTITLKEGHDLQRMFDKHIKFSALNTAEQETINTVMADARRALNGELMSKIESAGGPESLARIKDLNERFSIAKAISKGAKDYVKREGKNRIGSPTDYGTGFAGALMGLLGGNVPIGMAAGAASGYVHHVIRTEGNALAARALGHFAEGRGMVQLEEAFGQHGRQLANIPTAIERLSSGARHPVRETMGVNILTRFLGAEDAKLDDNDGVMAFADKLASLASDPTKLQQNIEAATADLTGDAPEVAIAAGLKLQQAAQYLHSKAPKPPSVPGPFDPPSHWQPTSAQARDFRTRVATAKDPYVAIDALADGSLTKAHVETLQALAPKIYQEMVRKVIDHGASGKAKPLPYAERLRLSMLTGAPLDRSLEQIASYQQTFATAPQQGKPSKLKGPQLGTDIQRISNS